MGRDKMIVDEILKILVPVAVAIFGWIVAHWFSMGRDRKNKKRDLQTKFLIDAYQKLEKAAHAVSKDHEKDFESAIADIQLFGSKQQIELATSLARELASKRHSEMNELLSALRNDLRTELGLARVDNQIVHLRFTEK
jgi:hypothetical protein